jgi:hypothetical protein
VPRRARREPVAFEQNHIAATAELGQVVRDGRSNDATAHHHDWRCSKASMWASCHSKKAASRIKPYLMISEMPLCSSRSGSVRSVSVSTNTHCG